KHILREFRHRVASRRRAAHANIEGPGIEIRERDFNLHPMMFGFREADFIEDGWLGPGLCSNCDSRCNHEYDRRQYATHGWCPPIHGKIRFRIVKCQMSHVECRMNFTHLPTYPLTQSDWVSG